MEKLNADLFYKMIDKIDLNAISEEEKELIGCVCRIRVYAYELIGLYGLLVPNHVGGELNGSAIEYNITAMLHEVAVVAAQHPEMIKYSADRINNPRAEIINAIVDTYNGLNSDNNVYESATQLARIIAINEDTDKERIGYTVLVGAILRIIDWINSSILTKMFE